MLTITVELNSAIDGHKLGVMHIANDGTGTPTRGNYRAAVMRKGSILKVQRVGEVRDYPRLSYNVWRLVSRALRSSHRRSRTHDHPLQET